MNQLFFFRILFLCLLIHINGQAQVNILNIPVQPFNLTPEALLNVNIMNGESEKRVQTVTQVLGFNNSPILTVRSQPFRLKSGLNAGGAGDRKIASFEFAQSSQANYLKTTHNLASGRYKVCSTLLIEGGTDKVDDFCEELEADFNQYLYLVNPFDGDTVATKYPILSWTHSEPFSLLNQGEFYRMIISEVKKGQSADEAITVNNPVMVKSYLKEHQLQYPYDARELKDGGRYAWQVQKISDGVVINKTEAWLFNTTVPDETKGLKYAALKRELDGSFYTAYDGVAYFRFSEEYRTAGQLEFSLRDARSQLVKVKVNKDAASEQNDNTSAVPQLKIAGDNRYLLNLNSGKLNSGFYTLEIKNEKNESFYLKILLP